MTICVPDTLTSDNSEKYEVSIRLWPGGLSFSGYIPMDKDSFFTETLSFDADIPVVQSLKDIFFDNPCFSYVYKSLYIVCASGKYTLVPDSVFLEKGKELLFSFCHKTDSAEKVLAQPLRGLNSSLLFGTNSEAYEFLMRSLVNPQFIHSLSPMLNLWRESSMACHPKQIYIFVHDDMFDIVCFERGEMLFINSFDYETGKDMVYYIMYVCKQLGIEQLDDCLHFCGDKIKCQSVMAVVKKYIRQIDYLSPEMGHYQVAIGKNVFIDTVALAECGL